MVGAEWVNAIAAFVSARSPDKAQRNPGPNFVATHPCIPFAPRAAYFGIKRLLLHRMRTGFAPADAEAFGERLGFGEIECGDVERWLRAQRLTNDRGRDAFTVDDNLKRLVDDLSGQPPHSRADGGTDIDFDIGPRICDGLPRILDEKRLFRVRLDAADRVYRHIDAPARMHE